MSTTIKDTVTDRDYLTILGGSAEVVVRAQDGGSAARAVVLRDEFLAAVEAECDVRLVPADTVIIYRADLPMVRIVAGDLWAGIGNQTETTRNVDCNAANLRKRALAILALAEYLDAHPPVDEAQFEGLVDRLVAASENGVSWPEGDARVMARRLYLAGVRIEAKP